VGKTGRIKKEQQPGNGVDLFFFVFVLRQLRFNLECFISKQKTKNSTV
jgi:hypothetical protein